MGEKKATPNETKRNGLGPAAVEPVAGFDNSSDTEKKNDETNASRLGSHSVVVGATVEWARA